MYTAQCKETVHSQEATFQSVRQLKITSCFSLSSKKEVNWLGEHIVMLTLLCAGRSCCLLPSISVVETHEGLRNTAGLIQGPAASYVSLLLSGQKVDKLSVTVSHSLACNPLHLGGGGMKVMSSGPDGGVSL